MISNDDIRALRAEAHDAGDLAMAAICKMALDGDAAARAECQRVIDDAKAQDDE